MIKTSQLPQTIPQTAAAQGHTSPAAPRPAALSAVAMPGRSSGTHSNSTWVHSAAQQPYMSVVSIPLSIHIVSVIILHGCWFPVFVF